MPGLFLRGRRGLPVEKTHQHIRLAFTVASHRASDSVRRHRLDLITRAIFTVASWPAPTSDDRVTGVSNTTRSRQLPKFDLMKPKKPILRVSLLAAAALFVVSALAQQITGTSVRPSATTTIDGKQLPRPAPNFGGVIKDDALQSTPWWAPRIVPPKGAPNILLIMTDDAGFACQHLRRRHPDTRHGPHRRRAGCATTG